MNNFIRLLVLLLFFNSYLSSAQDKINPWLVELQANTLTFINLPNWSPHIGPSISFFRHYQEDISFGVRYSQNTISTGETGENEQIDYRGLEGLTKFNINRVIKTGRFDPYVSMGLGLTLAQNINTFNILLETGSNYWFHKKIGLNLHFSYKHDFQDKNLGAFQYLGGIVIRFGAKDSDKDGTYDKIDVCPDTFGIPYLRGCPDEDGDGVADIKDDCPNVAGLSQNLGCPDSDGDGIIDIKDNCIYAFGEVKHGGCPDEDGDNVKDIEDKCPKIKGSTDNNGCPWPDRDHDFVPDKDDECPDVEGYLATNGCPEKFSENRQKQLNEYAKTILFNTGTTNINKVSNDILLEISFILKEFPNSKFIIEGHTDNTGEEKNNQKLSEGRAKAVYNALVDLNIAADRLKVVGYGELRPITTNSTESGKNRNRRVEINLIKESEVP